MQVETVPEAWTGWARRGAGLVAAAALSVVVVTGVLLTWRYRPDGGGPENLAAQSARWSHQLVRGHEASMLVAAPALLLWGGLTVWDRTVRSRRKGIGVAAAVIAIGMIALTERAWQRVRWENLALWTVAVDDDVDGLWFAAFSDRVRFAFVDGAEVSPGDMAPWVVVHLLAPVVALVTLAVGWLATEPRRSPRRSRVTPPVTDEPFELEVVPFGNEPE